MHVVFGTVSGTVMRLHYVQHCSVNYQMCTAVGQDFYLCSICIFCTITTQSLMHSVKSISWCIVWTRNSLPCNMMLLDQSMLLALL